MQLLDIFYGPDSTHRKRRIPFADWGDGKKGHTYVLRGRIAYIRIICKRASGNE